MQLVRVVALLIIVVIDGYGLAYLRKVARPEEKAAPQPGLGRAFARGLAINATFFVWFLPFLPALLLFIFPRSPLYVGGTPWAWVGFGVDTAVRALLSIPMLVVATAYALGEPSPGLYHPVIAAKLAVRNRAYFRAWAATMLAGAILFLPQALFWSPDQLAMYGIPRIWPSSMQPHPAVFEAVFVLCNALWIVFAAHALGRWAPSAFPAPERGDGDSRVGAAPGCQRPPANAGT